MHYGKLFAHITITNDDIVDLFNPGPRNHTCGYHVEGQSILAYGTSLQGKIERLHDKEDMMVLLQAN